MAKIGVGGFMPNSLPLPGWHESDLIALIALNLMMNIVFKSRIEVGRIAGLQGRYATL